MNFAAFKKNLLIADEVFESHGYISRTTFNQVPSLYNQVTLCLGPPQTDLRYR
jgi:hypothetical protein